MSDLCEIEDLRSSGIGEEENIWFEDVVGEEEDPKSPFPVKVGGVVVEWDGIVKSDGKLEGRGGERPEVFGVG